jgi:hypothetical protein
VRRKIDDGHRGGASSQRQGAPNHGESNPTGEVDGDLSLAGDVGSGG